MVQALRKYGLAVVLTGIGTAVVIGLNQNLSRSFFSVLTCAVILSAWYGGLGPGLLASVLSVLSINYFIQTPRYQLAVANWGDGVQLIVFTAAAVLISVLTQSRDRARREAGQATEQAQQDEAFAELARRGAAERDTERVIQLICEQAVKLTGGDYAGVRLLDESGQAEWRGMWGNHSDAWRNAGARSRSGSASRAFEAGKTIINRVQDEVRAGRPLPPTSVRVGEGAVVEMGTPLQSSGRMLGAIVIGWRTDVTPSADQIRIAEVLAAYAAAVLDNAIAHEESAKRRQEAETFAALVQQGAAETDPQRAISFICEKGCQMLGADYGAVLVVEDGVRIWHGGHGVRVPRNEPTRGRGTGPSNRALEAGKTIVLTSIQDEPDKSQFHAGEGGRVAVVAPCFGSPGFRSLLHFGWRRDVEITPDQVRLAETLSGYAAVILENARGHAALQERAETVRMANEQLLRVDEMKNNLISNVSHELRTPLSSIRAFSELLLDPDMEPATRTEFTRIINEESERLTRLVSNLLDLSRIQARGVAWNFRPLDVRKELEQAVASLRPTAEKKALDLRLEIGADVDTLVADSDGLQQALVNLISNAVKFTAEGEIVVTAERRNGSVRVSVRDTGPGMASDDQERVFDRFYQAGNLLTSKPAGTGLGLAITKEILLQHGTEIELESSPGQGSSFSFTLPASIESPAVMAESRP